VSTSQSCDQTVAWKVSSEGAGQVPGGQHQIYHQVPSLGKDMKSHGQLFAFDKKNENESRPHFNRMQFFYYRAEIYPVCH